MMVVLMIPVLGVLGLVERGTRTSQLNDKAEQFLDLQDEDLKSWLAELPSTTDFSHWVQRGATQVWGKILAKAQTLVTSTKEKLEQAVVEKAIKHGFLKLSPAEQKAFAKALRKAPTQNLQRYTLRWILENDTSGRAEQLVAVLEVAGKFTRRAATTWETVLVRVDTSVSQISPTWWMQFAPRLISPQSVPASEINVSDPVMIIFPQQSQTTVGKFSSLFNIIMCSVCCSCNRSCCVLL